MDTAERNSRVDAAMEKSRELERALRALGLGSATDTVAEMRAIILDDVGFGHWTMYHSSRDEYEREAEFRGTKAIE